MTHSRPKWFAFLLCMLVLLWALSCASAEVQADIPAQNRITVDNPYGLAFSTAYNAQEGLLTIRFSAEDTDWSAFKQYAETKMAQGEMPDRLAPDIWLSPPKNAAQARWWFYTGEQSDDRLYAQVQNEPAMPADQTCHNFLWAASCAKEADSFSVLPIHRPASEKHALVCQWLDGAGREIAFEKLYLAVEWDSLEAVALPGTAPAIGFPSADRVFFSADSAIAFAIAPSYDETTGLLHAVIDSEKTDWFTVMANSYHPASGEVGGLRMGFYPPEGAASVYSTTYGNEVVVDSDLLQRLYQDQVTPGFAMSCGANLGNYSEESSLLLPSPADQYYGHGIIAGWYGENGQRLQDGNGNVLPYEIMHFDVQFTSRAPIAVRTDKVSAACIIPDDTHAGITSEKADGFVKYLNPSVSGGSVCYKTVILAPENAASDWAAYQNGSALPMLEPADSGLARRAAVLTDWAEGESCIQQATHTITWKNNAGIAASVQRLTVEIQHGTPLLWPHYVEGLEPFPSDAVILSTHNAVDGATISYDEKEGIVRLHIDSAKVVAAAQTSNLAAATATASFQFTPPEGTVKYAVLSTGNDIIYGKENNLWFINNLQPAQSEFHSISTPLDYSSSRHMSFFSGVSFRLPDGSSAEYYTSSEPDRAGGLGGYVQLFYWYDKDDSIIGKNYVAYMYDDVNLITTSEVLEDEADLSDTVNGKKKPLIIADGKALGYGQGKLQLRAERAPSSPGTHRYELTLKSDENAEVALKGTGTLYLPYPEGYDETNCHQLEITISHYNASGTRINENFSIADGTIQCTKHGLRIEVQSLSPFVVSWEKKPAAVLVLPSHLTIIEADAFRAADFTAVHVPDSCTAIRSGAFADCLRLEQVSLPKGLTDIAEDAFPDGVDIIIRN